MKTWVWVLIGVAVIAVLFWSLYAAQQRKLAQLQADLIAAKTPQTTDQRTNVWDIVGGILGVFNRGQA